jgi:hypothetical protein
LVLVSVFFFFFGSALIKLVAVNFSGFSDGRSFFFLLQLLLDREIEKVSVDQFLEFLRNILLF